jgi:hypothetical protein
MPTRDNRLHQAIRAALRGEEAVWTPQCLEPETLLEWVEAGERHPGDAKLLDHVLGCAYCRREYADTLDAWMLSHPIAGTATPPVSGPITKLEAWLRELIAEGITQPIKAVQAVLASLDHLTAPALSLVTRSPETPADLRPAATAVRTLQPTLRWSAALPAYEYRVTLIRHTGRGRGREIWEGSAGSGMELTLPEQVGIEPGGVYLWHVTALRGDLESYSPTVGFAVLTEQMQQQLETQERTAADSPLARIALYEAYGLYAEALEEARTLIALEPADPIPHTIVARLEQSRISELNRKKV